MPEEQAVKATAQKKRARARSLQPAALDDVLIKWRDVLINFIKPLIPGCTLLGPYTAARRPGHIVSLEHPRKLRVFASLKNSVFFVLQKTMPFSPQEKIFLEQIIERLHLSGASSNKYFHLLAGGIIEFSIAEHIDSKHSETIYKVLQAYNQWSTQTYEGKRFSHTTGIYLNKKRRTDSDFFSLRNQNFMKNLGTSDRTLMALGAEGDILGIEHLPAQHLTSPHKRNTLAPIHAIGVASWTSTGNRCAIQLTQTGEILLFKEGKLLFAKRRFHWHTFPHSMIMEELAPVKLPDVERVVREAVYLTAIDIAFQEYGACIGIIADSASKKQQALRRVRAEYLFGSKRPSPTARLLAGVIGNRKFYELPRDLRVELCAIDGALILDGTGKIFTAGAILKTRGNAEGGGGRTAAAVTLAKTGFGIKVSEDGYIEIYKGSNPGISFA